jgi:HEAT repeat protein
MHALERIVAREQARTLPCIVASLDDKNWFIRWRGAQLVQLLGSEGAAAVPALIRCYQDKIEANYSRMLQAAVRDALVKIGPNAVPPLVDLLRNPETVDLQMCSVLTGIGASAVPMLLEILDAGSQKGKWCTLWVLFQIGPSAKFAGPRLLPFLCDPDASLRSRAIFALASMNYETEKVVEAAIKELEAADYRWRRDAAYALNLLGPAATKAVPHLVARLHDSSAEVREAAAIVLGSIGGGASEATADLTLALQDGVEDVHKAAAEALKKIQGTQDEPPR